MQQDSPDPFYNFPDPFYNFRIGGKTPDNTKGRQYIDSKATAAEWFSYAIGKHEMAEHRYNGSFYNQFRNNPA